MAENDERTVYVVAPIDATLGLCETCGCHLQHPGPYDGTKGSIWLTPWMDCGGHCTVCMAHVGDPDAIGALEHWLWLSKVDSPLGSS